MKTVIATVKSGECNQGFHKPGDNWKIGNLTPEGMCTSAFDALFPFILTLQCGGQFFWEQNREVTCASCPDDRGLIFEIKLAEE